MRTNPIKTLLHLRVEFEFAPLEFCKRVVNCGFH